MARGILSQHAATTPPASSLPMVLATSGEPRETAGFTQTGPFLKSRSPRVR